RIFASEKPTSLGEIEVSDGAPRQGDADPVVTSSVLTAEDFEGRSQTVSEVLSEQVGVSLKRYGGYDDFATVSIRGSTSEQVHVYLNGIPLQSAQGGGVNLSTIPLSQIERIEIYRGQTPSLFDASAIGGVVNIITKHSREEVEWLFHSDYGSWNSFGTGAFVGFPVGSWGGSAGYEFSHSDGDFSFRDDNGTPLNPDDDATVARQNNDFNRHSFMTHWEGPIGPQWSLSIDENLFREDRGVPGLGNSSQTADLSTTRNLSHLKFKYLPSSPKGISFSLNPFFGYTKSQFSDQQGEIGLGIQDNDDDILLYGARFDSLIPLDTAGQEVSLLFSYQGEEFLPENFSQIPSSGTNSRRDSFFLVTEDRIYFLERKIVLLPSFRLETHWNRLTNEDPSFSPASVIQNESTDTLLGGKFGAQLEVKKGVFFKGNVGRSFRAPNFLELFGDRGFYIGNPELHPETAINFDLGLLLKTEQDRWHSELTYFQTEVEGLIQPIQTSQSTVKALNLGKGRIQGIEMMTFVRPLEALKLSLDYTFERARDRSGLPATHGLYLPGRPVHELGAKMDWEWKILNLFTDLHFMDGNFLDSQNIRQVNHRTF
ncbi:MAG: TonB-dependent receptor, partial [bacterium]|nr:TonB-dependent receptor [bacterium]